MGRLLPITVVHNLKWFYENCLKTFRVILLTDKRKMDTGENIISLAKVIIIIITIIIIRYFMYRTVRHVEQSDHTKTQSRY